MQLLPVVVTLRPLVMLVKPVEAKAGETNERKAAEDFYDILPPAEKILI